METLHGQSDRHAEQVGPGGGASSSSRENAGTHHDGHGSLRSLLPLRGLDLRLSHAGGARDWQDQRCLRQRQQKIISAAE